MSDHFFVLMYATSGAEREVTRFQSYHDVNDVVKMVHEWLECCCAVDCIPAAQEAEVRAKNGGELPEMAFICPEVKEPKDLAQYNGFYDYESMGVFNIFLTPVYDRVTAEKFRAGMLKEFGIDQEYSERSDRMMEHLDTFVNCFDDPSIDYSEAEAAIYDIIMKGGFDLFGGDGEPDTIFFPGGSGDQFRF